METKKYESTSEAMEYLKDYLFAELNLLTPFVLIDPDGLVDLSEHIPYPYREYDLATMKDGELEKFLKEISHIDKPIILLRNIESVSSLKEKEDWKNIIVDGLKEESKIFVLKNDECIGGLTEYRLPFDKVKLICTCHQYPDFLKNKGNLGKGPDFTHVVDSE